MAEHQVREICRMGTQANLSLVECARPLSSLESPAPDDTAVTGLHAFQLLVRARFPRQGAPPLPPCLEHAHAWTSPPERRLAENRIATQPADSSATSIAIFAHSHSQIGRASCRERV